MGPEHHVSLLEIAGVMAAWAAVVVAIIVPFIRDSAIKRAADAEKLRLSFDAKIDEVREQLRIHSLASEASTKSLASQVRDILDHQLPTYYVRRIELDPQLIAIRSQSDEILRQLSEVRGMIFARVARITTRPDE